MKLCIRLQQSFAQLGASGSSLKSLVASLRHAHVLLGHCQLDFDTPLLIHLSDNVLMAQFEFIYFCFSTNVCFEIYCIIFPSLFFTIKTKILTHYITYFILTVFWHNLNLIRDTQLCFSVTLWTRLIIHIYKLHKNYDQNLTE